MTFWQTGLFTAKQQNFVILEDFHAHSHIFGLSNCDFERFLNIHKHNQTKEQNIL